MKWILVDGSVVDVSKYRLFRCTGRNIVGMSEYAASERLSGFGEESDIISAYGTEEQTQEAFETFSKTLVGLKSD